MTEYHAIERSIIDRAFEKLRDVCARHSSKAAADLESALSDETCSGLDSTIARALLLEYFCAGVDSRYDVARLFYPSRGCIKAVILGAHIAKHGRHGTLPPMTLLGMRQTVAVHEKRMLSGAKGAELPITLSTKP